MPTVFLSHQDCLDEVHTQHLTLGSDDKPNQYYIFPKALSASGVQPDVEIIQERDCTRAILAIICIVS